MKTLDLAVFAPGTYPSADGEMVTFTPAMLAEMQRNTDYLINIGVLTPPIKYDHPAHGDHSKDAHGHAVRTSVSRDGAFIVHNAKPSTRLLDDVEAGKRLRGSGEFFKKYRYVDRTGAEKFLGPVYVGFAALGADRQAVRSELIPGLEVPVKNYRRVPTEQVTFGEGVSDVDAHYLREELRKTGVLAQYFREDGIYSFSEFVVDPTEFREENTHMPVTEEEKRELREMMKGAATDAAAAVVAPLIQKVDSLSAKTDEQFKQFSERARNENEAIAWAEEQEKRVPLGLKASELRRNLAIKMANGSATYADYKQFCEEIPARIVSTDRAHGDDKGEVPPAIQKLRPADFDKPSENDARLTAGMKVFSEDPRYAAQFAIVRDKPYAVQQDALKTIVVQLNADSN